MTQFFESLSTELLISSAAAKVQRDFFLSSFDQQTKAKLKYMIVLEKTNYKRKPWRAPNSGPYVKSNGPAISISCEHIAPTGNEKKTFNYQLL